MVIEKRAWRRIAIATRGCTSRSARSEAQVRRASWTVILRRPALAIRASHERLKFTWFDRRSDNGGEDEGRTSPNFPGGRHRGPGLFLAYPEGASSTRPKSQRYGR